eukprot:CAMPEP_0184310162 /NCGR_PEP_ID=MMETSP1049-20130417/25335_1 /TAXON_ID=77928 /ORGANISM="Proteomonas sulcata, Strain CCMP704" /LENGTH=117 /DNA_ID=CAMNT_0026623835 /DNA_START=186 /DNA_END=539 /DNA_ORIENTATION=+
MMCAVPEEGAKANRMPLNKRPSGVPATTGQQPEQLEEPAADMGRRKSIFSMFKAGAAVVVGEVALDAMEGAAVREAAVIGAEEVAEAGAIAEGAAALKNGGQVMGEMNELLFGKKFF